MTEDPDRWGTAVRSASGSVQRTDGIRPAVHRRQRTVCPVPSTILDVPPTLVSFAVDVASDRTVITPELKAAGNKLVLFEIAERRI